MRKLVLGFLVCTLYLLASCASSPYTGINTKLADRDFQGIDANLEQAKTDKYFQEKDRVLYYLDLGLNAYYLGDYEKAIENLTQAEYSIEDLYTKSVSKEVGTWLLNDNVQAYAGEDYEDIYINLFKSLAFVDQQNLSAALVEIRRVTNKLNLLEDKYAKEVERYNSSSQSQKDPNAVKLKLEPKKNRFYDDALAHYLAAIMYRSQNNTSGARIEQDSIVSAFQNQNTIYPFPLPPLPSITPESDGKSYLNVVAFAGSAPVKTELRISAIYTNNFIQFSSSQYSASELSSRFGVVSIFAPGLDPEYGGGIYSLELPVLTVQKNDVKSIAVIVDGEAYQTHKIETLNTIAQDIYSLKLPLIIIKTVTRTIGKHILAKTGVNAVNQNTDGGGAAALTSLLANISIAASEQADIRGSHLLPSDSYVFELELPQGSHDVEIRYLDKNNRVLYKEEYADYSVKSGLNLLNTFYFSQ